MSDSVVVKRSADRRRGWRWLAATTAALMVVSVLSVAGGGPAQAANTASEDLKDTNADGVADSRFFAGGHRYQTAEMLARRFADLESGVSSVIIANGESQVDAVAAAGLAGSRNAPVLLTRPASLPHNVARFISDQNVTNVTIVGGTAAVSAAVETALKGLASKPTVTRLAGANRFATAAMIGDSLGGPNATWCGSNQRAAILVNGRDEGMSDAVVAGPLAYRLGLPVLLTEADELPAETRKFLTDNQVERVVVIGGTAAVSAGVINTLTEEVGVANAPRIAGANAAATSVAVAKEMRGACKDELNVDPDRVALLNSTATADGIAAAPVLGRGLAAGGGSVPILLVGSALPAEVREFLATTPNTRDGNKTHMNVVAVGGKAVVTDAVMAAAVKAAATGGELTATIVFNRKFPKSFYVEFEDDVFGLDATATQASVTDPNLYRINGRRLSAEADNNNITDPNEGARVQGALLLQGRVVTVTLDSNLKNGDRIEVIGGGKVGKNGDQRKLRGASLIASIPADPPDVTAPAVEIFAVARATPALTFFDLVVTEDNLQTVAGGNPYIMDGGVVVNKGTNTTAAPTVNSVGPDVRRTAQFGQSVTPGRPGTDGNGKGVARFRVRLSGSLRVGDVIEVKRGTFLDNGNRGNQLTRYTVKAPMPGGTVAASKFAVTSVSMGNKYPTTFPMAIIETGPAQSTAGYTVNDDARVLGLSTGIAAGAAGNAWRIFGYRLPTADPAKKVEIAVDVDKTHKIISYTVRNGTPKLIDLALAFNANPDFEKNFTIDYAATAAGNKVPDTVLGGINSAPVSFSGGKSAVALRVDFNDAILGFGSPQTGMQSKLRVLAFALMDKTVPASGDGGYTTHHRFLNMDSSIWITIESAETKATMLPSRTGIKFIPAGVVGSWDQTNQNNIASMVQGIRLDTSLRPFGVRILETAPSTLQMSTPTG